MTFEAIAATGVEAFLAQRRDEVVRGTYRPMRYRHQAIPKGDGTGSRLLAIPASRDRVVQVALTRILAPLCEAACQAGSYGYRPGRRAHDAVQRGAEAVVQAKPRVVDVDLLAYFANGRQHGLLAQVAQRMDDPDVRRGLRLLRTTRGKKGIAQGDVRAPL